MGDERMTNIHTLYEQASSLLQEWQQSNRLMVLDTPLGKDVLLAETWHGLEALGPMTATDLSRLNLGAGGAALVRSVHGFRFELTALSTQGGIDAAQLMGQALTLRLQTQANRDGGRVFHAQMTGFELMGSNGGMSRYRLILQPWLVFLGQRRDSYHYHDCSVFDILDELFTDYTQAGAVRAQWRYDIARRQDYPVRSLTTQWQETDLAFAERLMAEEGLFYWFEHSADGHTLVIADHSDAYSANAQDQVRFHRASVTEKTDSVQSWRPAVSLTTDSISALSWDYKTLDTRPVQASSVQASLASPQVVSAGLQQHLWLSPYAYTNSEHGQRSVESQAQGLEVRQRLHQAQGSVRTWAPATTFTLTQHPTAGDAPYVLIAVAHRARNNFNDSRAAGQTRLLDQLLGSVETFTSDQTDHYRNEASVCPASIVWRPLRQQHGSSTYPRPTVAGVHTGVVVGTGEPTHTDRDHRIKVQFPWQRGSRSASALAHPSGQDNAPASDCLGTWVRVLTPDAGGNWGSVFVPRVGQEVMVAYLEGDPDRPVVIGAAYNGQGQANAQMNQVSQGPMSHTGNAPVWFPGDKGAHAHGAVLSGLKTQELTHSQSGQGGYNQLVYDDSPVQTGTRWQTTQASSQLNLGHLEHQNDNQRQAALGHGVELTTQASGAVRGGSGVLISADARPQASSSHLDSREARQALQQAHSLAVALQDSAQEQQAALPGLRLEQYQHDRYELKRLEQDLDASISGSAQEHFGGGEGAATAWHQPHLVTSAPGGIASLTAGTVVQVSGQHQIQVAGHDINHLIQGDSSTVVGEGISWYTYGQAAHPTKPLQQVGVQWHAASGAIKVQAQSGASRITAAQDISVVSTQASVRVEVPSAELLLVAGGAFLCIQGGNITLGAPGSVRVSGAQTVYTGPASMNASVSLVQGALKGCEMRLQSATSNVDAFVRR
jgi:type VI secretion system secreted protein VgrG